MAQRTFILTGVLRTFGPDAIVGAPCSYQPLTPNGTGAVDGNGAVVSTRPTPFTTDQFGNFVAMDGESPVEIDYPGDFQPGYTNTQVRLVVNGEVTDSPIGFAYASSIAYSTWLGAAVTTGKVGMRLVYTKDDGTPVAGALLSVAITQPAVVVATGTVLASSNPSQAVSVADGTFRIDLDPNALLNPTGLAYNASIVNPDGTAEPATWTFTVPTVVDIYRGTYDNAFAYPGPGGSSNGDVVLSGGVLYRSIGATTGHAPPNLTYWTALPSSGAGSLPTDLITAPGNLTDAVAAGTVAVSLSNIAATRRTVTADTTIVAGDALVFIDATSNDVTATLPAPTGWQTLLWLVRTDATTHAVAAVIAGSLSFGGGGTSLAIGPDDSVLLFSDGTTWWAA